MMKIRLASSLALLTALFLTSCTGSGFQQEQRSSAPEGVPGVERADASGAPAGSPEAGPTLAPNPEKEQAPLDPNPQKILVAYFSHSGNTRVIADQIHKNVGGDLFEIVTVNPYPADYDECVEQAKQELGSDHRPVLRTKVKNLGTYDVVFIGYPNWWGTIPRPVATFLTEHDLSGTTLAPFCTHEGSRLGNSVREITKLCPRSTVLEGLAVRGSYVATARAEVAEWLNKIGIPGKDRSGGSAK